MREAFLYQLVPQLIADLGELFDKGIELFVPPVIFTDQRKDILRQQKSDRFFTAQAKAFFFPAGKTVIKARVLFTDLAERVLSERKYDPAKPFFI